MFKLAYWVVRGMYWFAMTCGLIVTAVCVAWLTLKLLTWLA